MTKRIAIAAGLAFSASGLLAQTGGGRGGGAGIGVGSGFQQAGTIGLTQGRVVMNEMGPAISWAADTNESGPLIVAGKPFSATEERKATQTLSDGTVLERSDSNRIYRDSEGRVRVEQTWEGKTVIAILDPVGRFIARLDPVSRTATKTSIPAGVTQGGIWIREGNVSQAFGFSGGRGGGGVFRVTAAGTGQPASGDKAAAEQGASYAGSYAAGYAYGVEQRAKAEAEARATVAAQLADMSSKLAAEKAAGSRTPPLPVANDDLGSQIQHGVMAQGSRRTLTIPMGQIGNNRDIHVVNERWYSSDLQMLIRSSNSDPRFGVTTYELNSIVQSAPDAFLFQIPSDYSLSERGGRGGRGFAPSPVK